MVRNFPRTTRRRAVAALAVGSHRVDGRAFLQAGLREDGGHVGGEAALQRLRRHEHVIVEPGLVQRLAIDDQRLRVGTLQLDGAGHQALDRVGHVVRLVEHVRRAEIRGPGELGLHQLVEHQEQPERLDRAGVQIVVAVFRIVEMESAEPLCVHQSRDDHLDVHVGRVVAEVHEAEGLRAQRLRRHQ